MDHDKREEARQYGRRELVCTLLDMVLDVVILVLFAFWWGTVLDSWLQDQGIANRALRLAAFFGLMTSAHLVVAFPLSVYSGYLLEHRFGLSRQSFGRWLRRYAVRTLLMVLFALGLVEGLYLLIAWTGPWWWLTTAAGAFVLSVVLGQLVPVLILPLFYKVERLKNEDLESRFERLAEGTGLRIDGVFRMRLSRETVKANAMLAGLGRTRRVLLGDTLLDRFASPEIEVVLAHEIGHHVHRHLPKMIALGVVTSALGFALSDVALRMRYGDSVPHATLPVAALPLLLLVVQGTSMALEPLRNALMRAYERQCDQYALRRTGNAEAYRSAFTRLAEVNKVDPDPPALEVLLFHDHPPIAERLAMADAVPE